MSLQLPVNFFISFCRSLSPLSTQNIAYVSFENTDSLEVYIENIDNGDKTIITEDIDFLTLSGRMYEKAASMRFFLRQSSTVLFSDFYASTPITLINIQVMILRIFTKSIWHRVHKV